MVLSLLYDRKEGMSARMYKMRRGGASGQWAQNTSGKSSA
jgi:hypothetical protein